MSREAGGTLEPSLVARARAGDVDAFEHLVRERADRVVRLAMAIVADETEARDVAQEAFITAWRQLADLRDADRFEAWLTRIVVNKARMSLRSKRRRHIREIPSAELTTLASDRSATAAHADAGSVATLLLPRAAVPVAIAAEAEGTLRLVVRLPAGGTP